MGRLMCNSTHPESLSVWNSPLSDEEVVGRVLAGDRALYEVLMRRYNQRLFPIARTILRDEAEAEDVVQETYVRAYASLHQFSTWLARIAVYEASSRLRQRSRLREAPAADRERETMEAVKSPDPDPEPQALRHEATSLLESAIDALPGLYRCVFVLGEIENMSTVETANCLDLSRQTVKVRLLRARDMLRKELDTRAGARASEAFQFLGARCDRVVRQVFERLNAPHVP